MPDYSIRIPVNNYRLQFLEKNGTNKQILSGITDIMYKPVGVDMRKYHPNKTCLRLRQSFGKESTLVEITTIKTGTGYTDDKKVFGEGATADLKKMAGEMGYEPWGEMTVSSTEYTLPIGKNLVSCLYQEIKPVGKFIKIEAPSSSAISNTIKAFKVTNKEIIERNAAVLLAEKMGLIK
jgi:hypothetical protein